MISVINSDQISVNADGDDDFKGYKILISTDELQTFDSEEDDDDSDNDDVLSRDEGNSGYYITEFVVEAPDGTQFVIKSENSDKMMLSADLTKIVEKKLRKDADADIITVDLNAQVDYLFNIILENNEITKRINRMIDLVDKSSVTSSYDKDGLLQAFIEALNDAKMSLASVHAEVIFSNQIVSVRDKFRKPNLEYDNEPYEIYSLSKALYNNPSITVSLSYQNVPRQLYDPKTFKKHKPSCMDLNFMEHPQEFLSSVPLVPSKVEKDDFVMPKHAEQSTVDESLNPFIVKDIDHKENPFIVYNPDNNKDK
jgi:hypothetical protein